MARVGRMALDVALVSVKKVVPVVSSLWNSSKSALSTNAKAKKILEHNLVQKLESVGDVLKPAAGTAWQYCKTECAPPMTLGFLHGPGGKKLEEAVSGVTNGILNAMRETAQAMDAAEAKAIQDKENAVKAAVEKLKEQAKKKLEEQKRKIDEKNAKERKAAETKAEAKAEAKKPEAKKADDKKPEIKKAEPKKDDSTKPKK